MSVHPALRRHAEARGLQNRLADGITAFAGSMTFVYLHMAAFFVWMRFIEHTPWPNLTLIVSLEAIFLSTFVLISQNRADSKRGVIADHDHEVDCENLELTKRIAEKLGIDVE